MTAPPWLVRSVVEVYRRRASRYTGRCARRWQGPVVVIDGRSGSGKTSLAVALAQSCRAAGVRGLQVIHMDQLYAGWGGLEAGTHTLEGLLMGVSAGGCGFWLWNWVQDCPGSYVSLDPRLPLLVEGFGALTPLTQTATDLAVWVEVDSRRFPDESAERKRRALKRDGDMFAPWWDRWARQEAEHIARCRPRALADVAVSR